LNAGVTVARILGGAWRAEPPPPDFGTRELEAVERQLFASGAAALAWWRVRGDPALRDTPVGARLHDAYRLHALHARLHEDQLVRVVAALNEAGIDPLLLKGWDAAGLYPERALRPYGDIDLWVRTGERPAAVAALSRLEDGRDVEVGEDTEIEFREIEFRGKSVDEVFAASHRLPLGDGEVGVMCAEDRLRAIAVHFLKHGGWRPLWLCDVAAAAEMREEAFDWGRCLTGDRVIAGWVSAALALAGRLLGADMRGVPAMVDPPRWLVRSVLRRWAEPWPVKHNAVKEPLSSLAHPVAVARGLGSRWADPVSATVELGRSVGRVKPVHLQVLYQTQRLARYLTTQRERR